MTNLTGKGYFVKGHKLMKNHVWKKETNLKRSLSLKKHKNFNLEKKGCFEAKHIPWNKGTHGIMKGGMSGKKHTTETKLKISIAKNKGKTKENNLLRKRADYFEWRTKVYTRDNYTCQKCGKISGKLNAHHIEKFSENKSKALEVSNGITLCENCHKKEHKGGIING
jgi:hypothetical protein